MSVPQKFDPWCQPSPFSVSETLDRLELALGDHETIKIFARIDHRKVMADAAPSMRPIEMLLFQNGNLAAEFASDDPSNLFWLPIRALAWEDENGRVWLRVTDPAKLQSDIASAHVEGVFDAIRTILGKIVTKTLNH